MDMLKDKTPDPYILTHANEVQGCDVETVEDQLENTTQMENDSLSCKTDRDATTEQRESSDSTHSKGIIIPDYARNVVVAPMIVDFTDVGDVAETNIVRYMSAGAILTSDSSKIDSEPQKIYEDPETDIISDGANAGCPMTKGFPDEGSEKVEEVDLKSCHPLCEQTEVEGQQESQSELFSCTESCPAEINADENLNVFTDSAQIEYPSDMVDNCIVKGNAKDNLNTSSLPSNLSVEDNSEMKHSLCEDHWSTEPNQSLISAGVELIKEPEDPLQDTVLKVFQSELISMKSGQSADVPRSNMQLPHEESGKRTAISGLSYNLNLKGFACETDIPDPKFEVVDGLGSNGIECPPHATVRESLGAQAIALDAAVAASCETDVTQIQLEEFETECPFEEQGAYCGLSCEAMQGNNVEVEDAGCDQVSGGVSEAGEATNVINDSQHGLQELTESTLLGSVLGAEGMNINSGCTGISRPCSDELNLQLSLQDTSIEPTASNYTDRPFTQNEAQIEHIETETSLAKPLHEELVHEKAQMKNLENTYGLDSDELLSQKDLQERSNEPAVGDNMDRPVADTEIQIKHIESESNLLKQPHEEPDLHEINKVGLGHHDAQSFSLEGNTTLLVDPQACAHMSAILDDCKTSKFSEVAASDTCHQSLKEGGGLIVCEQQFGATLVASDASVDSNNSQRNSLEPESSHAKQPHEELDHQKSQNKYFESISELHSDELNHLKDLQGRSIDPAVQTEQIERESILVKETLERPDLNESAVGVRHHGAQNFTYEGHITSSVDLQAYAQTSVTFNNSKTSDCTAFSSGSCDQSLQGEGDHTIRKKHSDASLVATDASVDSNSRTDNVEGQWGFVSVPSSRDATDGSPVLDTQALPAINNQTPKSLHASNSATEGPSSEIQPMQNPQQSNPSQSKERKKDDLIEVMDWSYEESSTPLRNLLVEATLESKQKETNEQHHNSPLPNNNGQSLQDGGPTAEALSSKMDSGNSSKFSFNITDQEEWNSPARLPPRKKEKRVKGKPTWRPFMCCKYVS